VPAYATVPKKPGAQIVHAATLTLPELGVETPVGQGEQL
jgi:hypothetical protein